MANKRANHEGTIYYRANRGEWCAQISLEGRRLTKYAKTQGECREWVFEMRKKIGNGLTFYGTQMKLAQFVVTWLDGKGLSRRPHTVEQYRQIAMQYILPAMGEMRLQDIQPSHIKQLYLKKKEDGAGARTVQLIHAVLYSVLKQAVKEGLLGRNPVDAVERPKVEQAEHQILTEEQARQLVIASMGSRFGMLFYLALMTGIREGELLGLKWSDVDWSTGLLHVQRQLQRIKNQGLVLVPPKTKAGKRDVKLGQGTLDRLAVHRERQELEKTEMGERWEENELIFPNTLGKPMVVERMYEAFKQLLQENGLPDIRFHDLRHTSLSYLLDMGTSVNTVQQRAGHSKASVTTDVYGHAVAHSQDEAAQKLEERFTPVAVKLQSK
jgi:integrase